MENKLGDEAQLDDRIVTTSGQEQEEKTTHACNEEAGPIQRL